MKESRGALFQVASQFNLLEMTGPTVTPEDGVARYENDRTQGPACAIAAGAGTIYRNYLVPVGDRIGQTATSQVDCLADLGTALGNSNGNLWEMRNGYAMCSTAGLRRINTRLRDFDDRGLDELRGQLRIGLQWDVQVTDASAPPDHLVSQAFCAAVPVAYSSAHPDDWAHFASLVLESAYEATVLAAALNRRRTGVGTLFLTRLGGGAFGNRPEWIDAAMLRALRLAKDWDLDVALIHWGAIPSSAREALREFAS